MIDSPFARSAVFGSVLRALLLLTLAIAGPWSWGVEPGEAAAPPPAEQGTGQRLPADIAPALAELSSADSATRMAAVVALGERGDPKLLPLFEAYGRGACTSGATRAGVARR
jgi:hypothetical protein